MESLDLSIFDYVVIGIITLSGLISFFKGFIQESLSLMLWIFAFAASIFLNEYLDSYFSDYINNPEIRRVLLIVIMFIGILFVGGYLVKLIRNLIQWSGMGGLDRLLGVIFGFIRGIILILLIYLILPSELKQSNFIENSNSAQYLKKYAPLTEKFFKSMISNRNSVMLESNISTIQETT